MTDAIPIPAELQRAWLRQLLHEMDTLLFTYRLPMRPAALRLEDWRGTWGRFEPDPARIVLSLRLLREHDWDIVLEVLKHEMAHQWVHVAGLGQTEGPHGPAFRAACARLAVAGWAAPASGPLPERLGWPAAAATPRTAALHAKVRKLLALATSSNVHEAALAMRRVQEISARHALQQAEAAELPDQVHHIFNRKKRRIDRREALIVGILTDHFGVQALYTSQYVAAEAQAYKVVEICGSRHQVQLACHVYAFLQGAVDRLVAAHPDKWQRRPRGKASYVSGILDGFAAKLRQQALPVPSEMAPARAQALLRRSVQATAAYLHWRHPRVRQRAWSRGALSPPAYAAGQLDGQSLSWHRPLEGSSQARGRLLPAAKLR